MHFFFKMSDTTIDITSSTTGSGVGRKGLMIRRNEPESFVAEVLAASTKTIPFDYQAIRDSIRERALCMQKTAHESGWYYDMTSSDTIPRHIKTRHKMSIIYGPACYSATVLCIVYIISLTQTEYASPLSFVFFVLVGLVIPLLGWYCLVLRPVLLSCHTFKEITHNPTNKEIDSLFERAVQDALHEAIKSTAHRLVSESRIRTHTHVSPLSLALGKPDQECILKIIPYPEDDYEDCYEQDNETDD